MKIPRELSRQCAQIMEKSLIWDNHGCMPIPISGKEPVLEQLQRYRDGGVDVAMINIGDAEISLEEHFRTAAAVRHWVESHPEDYVLAQSVQVIRDAKVAGRLAVGFDIEGARVIGDQLSLISLFYAIGVRWMLVAYNRNNLVGGGCHDDDCGLTEFGRAVMDEMDRVGMVKCCAHTGYRTAMEVLERSPLPVIFSHSNPRSLKDHPRNVPDDLMLACAKTGGVMGINGVGIFLGDNDISIDTVLRHIDYAVNLMGPEHVGIGLDYVFDQVTLNQELEKNPGIWPAELGYGPGIKFLAPEMLAELAEGMLSLGYSEVVIRGILGENFLRVAQQVWK